MRQANYLKVIVAICVLFGIPAIAETAGSISIQGKLTDATGSPLAAGIKTLTFRIFDASSGGSVIWPDAAGETQSVTTDETGLWNAQIGAYSQITHEVFANGPCWLEITVDDGMSSPETLSRILLGPTSNSYRVATIDGASGGLILGKLTIGTGHTNDGADAFVAGRDNMATGDWSAVGGGHDNQATGMNGYIGGGRNNMATEDASTVGGGRVNVATGVASTVGGGQTIICSGFAATVGGGDGNRAQKFAATVAGGMMNYAMGAASTVSGGEMGMAHGDWSTIGGGIGNMTEGMISTIPGGSFNRARGDFTIAMGAMTRANHDGAVMIAANSSNMSVDSIASGGPEQMVLRADGGLFITSVGGIAAYDPSKLINTPSGAHLSASGAWTNASDIHLKENFVAVDPEEMLRRVMALDLREWNYRSDVDAVKHFGPTAQDFYAQFGLGSDDLTISTIDPAGVSLAAIQALYARAAWLERNVEEKELLIDELLARLSKLEERIDRISVR